jgi:hypothetical protein
MPLAKQRLCYVTVLCTVLSLGCRLRSPPAPDEQKIPHSEGWWSGRIEAIKMYDVEGGSYDAAVLRINGGPQLPHQVPDALGGGRAPILCEYIESNYRVVPASRLPVGKSVEVEGLMVVHFAIAPYRASPWGDIDLGRHQRTERKAWHEHIIIIKGKPKVLKE